MGRTLKYEGPNGFYRVDDKSGFPTRAYDTRREWTGLIVDKRFWEPRHPQDFVKGRADDQSVPNPRPLATDTYSGPIAIALSANAAIGATFLTLGSIAGLSAGDSVGVMLNTGVVFKTTISGNPTSTGVNISSPLPYAAASGSLLIDYSG